MTKTVVIVDDFKSIRNVVRKTLERKGFNVLEAIDGEDALKYFDGTEIDLLISDYDMPNLNGAGLVKEVRKNNKYKDIPIFMLTSRKQEQKQHEVEGMNISQWIKKPFDIFSFYKEIEESLK